MASSENELLALALVMGIPVGAASGLNSFQPALFSPVGAYVYLAAKNMEEHFQRVQKIGRYR